MEILDGKIVAENIEKTFKNRILKLKKMPYIAILGITGNKASEVYINKIAKNCEKYNIKCDIMLAEDECDFEKIFNKVKQNEDITGIMFQQPLSKTCQYLINELNPKQDIEGISFVNMGKLLVGEECLKPCTSEAVIKIIEYYNINLTGKKVTIVGRSNIVGKPLIPQILLKNATVTICHSKTENIENVLKESDVIIMAIGKAKFLKANMIKKNAIIIDVGINFENGKMCGDVDFENIKNKALMCTPVPGGVGSVTNALLINNIIKSVE